MSQVTTQSNPKAALLIAGVAICLLILVQLFQRPQDVAPVSVPYFSNAPSVQDKKQMFFAFFTPLIDRENHRIESVRQQLVSSSESDSAWMIELAERYRVALSDSHTQNVRLLLEHIDVIPRSLALAQAAIESAWGTSRFATSGYNYFGQWCFSKGCGMVPAARDAKAIHEVQRFDDPQDSVNAYMRNLNRHPTYRKLRALRLEARNNGLPIHGCELALGLENYSEKGLVYVNEIRQLIRVNNLTPHDEAVCQSIELPEPAQEFATAQDTTDHSQEASSKNTKTSESAPAL